jgi:hypothetical protein
MPLYISNLLMDLFLVLQNLDVSGWCALLCFNPSDDTVLSSK